MALTWKEVEMTIDGIDIVLATVHREGPLSPIMFLHGFGSTKEDYLDICMQTEFDGRPFLAYDTPGSGSSTCSDLSKLSVPFLVAIARRASELFFGTGRLHLVGHSMGGLTALLLAQQVPGRVASFVNIKGNLAPEDCFLSRQIIQAPSGDAEAFLRDFIERTRRSRFYGDALYAAALRAKVHPGAVRPTFESMVHVTDTGDLLGIFEGFGFPRMYMFGEQFASLSYLPRLAGAGVRLAEIPRAGHFVMYSNAPAAWDALAGFLDGVEGTSIF